MKVLVTGDRGYIGRVMVPYLLEKGYDVVGVDNNYYKGCDLYKNSNGEYKKITKDIRNISKEDLEDIETIHHLAALSNDPLGRIDPELTYDINLDGTVRLARIAKEAGIERFVFSSSCSVYGSAEQEVVDETSSVNPLTAYAKSKVRAEEELKSLADDNFTPVFLRNATAYGLSPRLRFDIVVNNLTGWAVTTGKVVIKSDGAPWRPLVHIRDIAKAFDVVTRAKSDLVKGEAFNVGANNENYQIRDLARIVGENVPNVEVTYGDDPSPDSRTYRVKFDKIEDLLGFSCERNVPTGVRELYEKFNEVDLSEEDFHGSKFRRLDRINSLLEKGLINEQLRISDKKSWK